ncbi:transcriptional regulator family: Fungal Specific TF [Paecilomyces variotii]|nr:transcriptional regulator family: Fungal Specific TF [Paecilomyces variotii]KAJ9305091.1 transcriptional regulator family: Fungal Specific TF [Paecilomyces variotii]
MSSAASNTQIPAGGGGVTKRKSGSAACVHCHLRKVRCDARIVGLPCSNCRSSGKTDCRIHEKKKRPVVRSILDPVPIRCRPPSVPDTSSKPLSPVSPIRAASTVASSPGGIPPQSVYTGNAQGPQNGSSMNQRPGSYNQQASSESSTDHEDHRGLEKRLVKLIDEDELDQREIQRGVRAIYVGHDVSNISFLIRQQRGKDGDVYHFAGNDIPKRHLRTGHDELLKDAVSLPEKALADELVQAYFAHVNPGYPIVDEDVFMTQYRNHDPSDPPPILVLQAILLVGAHVSRPMPERDALKETFFRRCKWLFDARVERNRDILVQVALLLTWHSDSTDDDVSANAYYWVGVAARLATGIGMHRNPVSSRFTAGDRRMWRRVWWILVQFDVMVSLSYGRPQAINLDDSDVLPLTPSDFEGCGAQVQVDFVIHFTELCTMISYILKERFGLKISPERRKAALPQADAALADWSLQLPDTLRLRASDLDPWSAVLHLTYNNFLILLHRPHPRASAYSDDYGPHDAEICSTGAGVIASIFEELRQKDRLKYLWSSSVYTLLTAMIQVRVELRFSNPVLAINALRRFDSTLYSLRELAEYWAHAGMVFRLFEGSKRLQQDLRLAKTEMHGQFNGPRGHSGNSDSTSNTATPMVQRSQVPPQSAPQLQRSHSHIQQSSPSAVNLQNQNYDPFIVTQPRFADTSFEGSEGIPPPEPVEHLEETRGYSDWRQLFPFVDTAQSVPMAFESLPEMEDEWRQLYWQEPQMSDLFQDGGWMHG